MKPKLTLIRTFKMENLDIVKEERFRVGDKPWMKRFFTHIEDIQDNWTAKCIYAEIDGEIKLIDYSVRSPTRTLVVPRDFVVISPMKPRVLLHSPAFVPKGKRKGFVNYLKKYKPASFKDILFLLDLYPEDIEDEIKRHKPLNSVMGDAIEEILDETKGIILWNYQMERVLNLFIKDRDEIVAARKAINAGMSPDFYEKLCGYKIDKKTTLPDLISNRIVFHIQIYPNIDGAFILYEILRK